MRSRWTGRSRRRTINRRSGDLAEDHALQYLVNQGLQMRQRNFRCRHGELDLILQDDDCLVIVEVRSRARGAPVPPALTVDQRKQERIARATEHYLSRHDSLADLPIRFDVVAIDGAPGGPLTLQWIKDAFRV